MRHAIHGCWTRTWLLALAAGVGASVCGQTPPAPQGPPGNVPASAQAAPARAAGRERFAFGFRLRSFPVGALSVMDSRRIMATTGTGKTASDLHVATTSHSPWLGGGLASEVRLGPRMTLTAELLFDRLRYERVTETYSGTDDPATGQDERSHAKTTESTQARLWDLPVLVHYRGLRSSGLLSHLYVAGGLTGRTVSRIRTTNQITNPDGSSATNHFSAQPARRNLLGGVVGLGFRFIDEFNIKVTPEIRYIRWRGASFSADTTRSPKDQLEFGIGFTR